MAVFLILLLALVAIGHLPIAIPGLYLLASLVTFGVYAVDKSAARQNQWRTQESTLHLLALLGGWPGVLLAQRWLRHKSTKQIFQNIFWLTVILNCAGLIGLLTPAGSAMLNSFLAG